MLNEIVQMSPKQRFAMSDDGLRIRANQGHSVDVELGLETAIPPEVLFHGTMADRLQSIRSRGLQRMKRHHRNQIDPEPHLLPRPIRDWCARNTDSALNSSLEFEASRSHKNGHCGPHLEGIPWPFRC